jgi:hypothetical protein
MDAEELLAAIQRVISEQRELEKWQRHADASPRSYPDGKAIAFDKIKELVQQRHALPKDDSPCLPNMKRPFAL